MEVRPKKDRLGSLALRSPKGEAGSDKTERRRRSCRTAFGVRACMLDWRLGLEMDCGRMPTTLEQASSQALLLPEKDRALLAHVLISSLETDERDFSAEWDAEIRKRVEEIDQGKATGRPAADVIRDIRTQLP